MCVNREDSAKLLLAENWPADITVSAWRFKAKALGDNSTRDNHQAASPRVDTLSVNIANNIAAIRDNLVVDGRQPDVDVVDVVEVDGDQTTIYDPYNQTDFKSNDVDFPALMPAGSCSSKVQ